MVWYNCTILCYSSDGSLDREINVRICRASQALGRLRSRVLNQHNIQLSNKLQVCKTVALSSPLYGCETCTLYSRRYIKLLEPFHMRSLHVPSSAYTEAGQDHKPRHLGQSRNHKHRSHHLKSPASMDKAHVMRMMDSRPKQLLYGELCLGKTDRGRPRKRLEDCVKANITPQAFGSECTRQLVCNDIAYMYMRASRRAAALASLRPARGGRQ